MGSNFPHTHHWTHTEESQEGQVSCSPTESLSFVELLQGVCRTVSECVWNCFRVFVELLQGVCGTVLGCLWNCYRVFVELLQGVCGTATECLWNCFRVFVEESCQITFSSEKEQYLVCHLDTEEETDFDLEQCVIDSYNSEEQGNTACDL